MSVSARDLSALMNKVLLAILLLSPSLNAAIPGAEALGKLITSQFDTNSDAIIDQGEWQSGIADSFEKLDSNQDGAIKGEEIDGLSEDITKETGSLAGSLVVVLIKQLIMSLDSDGDKAVTRKEYDKPTESIFTKLDADKNTSLTLAELSELPSQLVSP